MKRNMEAKAADGKKAIDGSKRDITSAEIECLFKIMNNGGFFEAFTTAFNYGVSQGIELEKSKNESAAI